MYELAILSIFPLAMIFAAVMDLFTMTIPNKISIGLIIGFFLLAPFAGLGFEQIAIHLGAGTLTLLVSLGLFSMGWVGGGDAKLLSATALWMGFENLLPYLLIASLAGGALTLILLFVRTLPLPLFLARYGWISRLHDPEQGVPYGIALATAALFVYPSTFWLQSLSV